MKLQRSTLVLLLVALGLAGAVYVFEIRESEKQEKIASQQEQIFTFSQDDVQSFTVTLPEQTITIERINVENTDSPSPWKITNPVEHLANPAAVNAVLNQLVNSQTDPTTGANLRRLTIDAEELSNYGLDQPQQTIDVILKDNQTHRLALGTSDFTGESIYGQIDSDTTSVLVIPKGILTTIDLSLEDWKFVETPEETVEETEVEIEPEDENIEREEPTETSN